MENSRLRRWILWETMERGIQRIHKINVTLTSVLIFIYSRVASSSFFQNQVIEIYILKINE